MAGLMIHSVQSGFETASFRQPKHKICQESPFYLYMMAMGHTQPLKCEISLKNTTLSSFNCLHTPPTTLNLLTLAFSGPFRHVGKSAAMLCYMKQVMRSEKPLSSKNIWSHEAKPSYWKPSRKPGPSVASGRSIQT